VVLEKLGERYRVIRETVVGLEDWSNVTVQELIQQGVEISKVRNLIADLGGRVQSEDHNRSLVISDD
jgi:hypothetical protein